MSSTTPITDLATEALFRELADCEAPGELEGLLDIERRLRDLSFDTDPAAEEAAQASDLGRFEHQDLIGRGGQSLVFRAMDPRLDREVAIKVHSGFGTDGALGLRRMVHEARALAHLDLPGVVRIYDAYEEDGRAFVVMESVDGPPLSELIDVLAGRAQQPTEQSLALAAELEPIEARCRLIRDLARSLFAVHERGVIHRDVKPANVLVEDGLRPKWIDFGLSHKDGTETELTTGFLIGTPSYISAEQVKNRRTGASALSDQYSLGVLFYELLTLGNPFRRDTREETLDAIAAGDPPSPRSKNPRIPVEVERIVLHMLEPVPQARYADARALAKDLEAFLEHRPISIGSPNFFERVAKWQRRNAREVRWSLVTLGLLMLVSAILFVFNASQTTNDLEAQLERAVGRLKPGSTPAEALEVFEELKDVGQTIQRQRGLLVGWMSEGIPIERYSERASEWLADQISKDEQLCAAESIPFEPSAWQGLLDLELELCPDCHSNEPYRSIGTLTYPSAAGAPQYSRLRASGERPFPTTYPSTPARRLTQATYRAVLNSESGELLREHMFVTSPDRSRIEVLARLPSQRVLAECVPLSFGTEAEMNQWANRHPNWEQRNLSLDDRVVFSNDFRIHPRLVTWQEILNVFGEPLPPAVEHTLEARLNDPKSPARLDEILGEPARVLPIIAYDYASALGLRLPTGLEWLYAFEHREDFEFDDWEYICWPGQAAGTTFGVSSKTDKPDSPLSPHRLSAFPNEAQFQGIAFRVASSVRLRDESLED